MITSIEILEMNEEKFPVLSTDGGPIDHSINGQSHTMVSQPQNGPGSVELKYCGICGVGFKQPYDLQRHILSHDQEHEGITGPESDQFSGLQDQMLHLNAGIREISGEQSQSCDSQNVIANVGTDRAYTAEIGQTHEYNRSNQSIKVEIDRAEIDQSQFLKRKQISDNERTEATRETYIEPSPNLKKGNDDKLHACDFCDYKSKLSHDLKRHTYKHTGQKPFSCGICDFRCTQKNTLRRHMYIHTGEKPFTCSTCGKNFTQVSNLNRHMAIHTEEKSFLCTVCFKSFREATTLKKHVLFVHTEEKHHTCGVCLKQFATAQNLRRHMFVHTAEKPETCQICNQQYAVGTLTKHMLIHSDEKRFSCEICGKRCRFSGDLKRHMSIHTRARTAAT